MSDFDRQARLEFIMDHYQNPRNHGEMPDADAHVEGGLPGCSDLVTMFIKVNGERVTDVSFVGEGCTISQASASALTAEVKGMTVREIEDLDFEFISEMIGDELVKTRPRCATLSLDTLKAALREYRNQQIRKDSEI